MNRRHALKLKVGDKILSHNLIPTFGSNGVRLLRRVLVLTKPPYEDAKSGKLVLEGIGGYHRDEENGTVYLEKKHLAKWYHTAGFKEDVEGKK